MGDVRFTGNWNSVNTHTVPKWYEDCKFGIFIHWGIYSVPAFAPHTWELGEVDSKEWFADNPYAEWYYNSLNIGKGPTYKHHIENTEKISNTKILFLCGKLKTGIRSSGQRSSKKQVRSMLF